MGNQQVTRGGAAVAVNLTQPGAAAGSGQAYPTAGASPTGSIYNGSTLLWTGSLGSNLPSTQNGITVSAITTTGPGYANSITIAANSSAPVATGLTVLTSSGGTTTSGNFDTLAGTQPAATAPTAPTFGATTTGSNVLPTNTQALTANATSEVIQYTTDAAGQNPISGSPFAVPTPGTAVNIPLTSGQTYYASIGMSNGTAITYGPATQVNFDTTGPTFPAGSAVINAAGTGLTLTATEFSPPLTNLAASGITLALSGGAATLSNFTINGKVVTATISRTVLANETGTISIPAGAFGDSAVPTANTSAAVVGLTLVNGSTATLPYTVPERGIVFQGAQIMLEATPGSMPAAPQPRRLLATKIMAVPKPKPVPFKDAGTKGITQVQQAEEVTEANITGALSYTELPYLLESLLKKSPAPVLSGTQTYTRTYVIDARNPTAFPQTYTVETGSSLGAERFAFALMKQLTLKTSKSAATVDGMMIGWPLQDGSSPTPVVLTPGGTDVVKAQIDPSSIGVYIGDNPPSLTRLVTPLDTELRLNGLWKEQEYQNDTNKSYDGVVECAPDFGIKITAGNSSQCYMLLSRLRVGQSIYVGLQAKGAVIEVVGGVTYTYGLLAILPCKVVSTGREDKDSLYAHDFDFAVADDTTLGLCKIAITTAQATL